MNVSAPMEYVPYAFIGCRDDDSWKIFHMNRYAKKYFSSKMAGQPGSLHSLFSAHVLKSLKSSPDNLFVMGKCLADGNLYALQGQRVKGQNVIFIAVRKSANALPEMYTSAFSPEKLLNTKLTIDDISFAGQRVIMRVDYNVPMNRDHTSITNDYRIQSTLPTLRKILADSPKYIVLIAHWGQPKDAKYNVNFSLRPIVNHLQAAIGASTPIAFAEDCMNADSVLQSALPGSIILLENLRFAPGEQTKASPAARAEMAAKLASYADIYVNDAFGVAHRAAVSTVDLPKRVRTSVAGRLMNKELKYLSNIMQNPESPIFAIVGGAKVTDKIKLLKKLVTKVDFLAIGGAMANPFLKAKGISIGKSFLEKHSAGNGGAVKVALDLIQSIDRHNMSQKRKVQLLLPLDHTVSPVFRDVNPIVTEAQDIPDDMMALDIGPKTVAHWRDLLMKSKTILWMGPVGVFEYKNFRDGTVGIARAIGHITEKKGAVSVVGGGDTVSAVQLAGVGHKISHVSTGGGATLALLEGQALPGIVHLTTRVQAKL